MALTIVATAKATNANSYVTLAEAESFLEGRLAVTDWDADTDDNKNRALRMSTDVLDGYDWTGRRSTQNQRLQWPRYGVSDKDGWLYDGDTVPRPVKEATYELANALIDGTYAVAPDDLEKYERVKVDVIEVALRSDYRAAQLPDHVYDLVAHLLVAGAGSEATFRTVRT
jgi:hypothetical protein